MIGIKESNYKDPEYRSVWIVSYRLLSKIQANESIVDSVKEKVGVGYLKVVADSYVDDDVSLVFDETGKMTTVLIDWSKDEEQEG